MDRVAELSLSDAAGKQKRKCNVPSQQKRGSGSKVARTDSASDGSMMDVTCSQASDSAQSAGPPCLAAAAATSAAPAAAAASASAATAAPAMQRTSSCDVAPRGDDALPQQRQSGGAAAAAAAAACEEDLAASGSEAADATAADAPAAPPLDAARYIRGTRLLVGGWFQACRGCNEPTAHTAPVGARDVHLCPRCQAKYAGMVSGAYPPNVGDVDEAVEPLSYWLPRVLGAVPRMAPRARREFCDALVLRQDDAWRALIRSS